MGAAFGMLALASCQQEEIIYPEMEGVKKSIPFELLADTPTTKTTIDANTWEMDWENGDILYAVTTDEEWGKAYTDDNEGETIADFTYSGGKFTTSKEISEGEHTFNFLYTANASQRSYHRGSSTSFNLASAQTEDASDPTVALKVNDVLAGTVKTTTPTKFVNVPMNHLFTLMKVTLKNKTGKGITVDSFEMSAPDADLAGIFNVAFGDTPSISLKQNGKSSVSVSITNGTVATDGEIPVFFVIAPLANYSGDITFTVTDTEGNTYTKTNTVSGVTFEAGKYNTATYSLKNADPVECVELDWTYPEDGSASSEGLNAIPGVTSDGLGSDYAASHSPYCIKFDNTNDFIQIRTDKSIGSVSVKYKMIGGGNVSKLEIHESTTGATWNKVEDLTISGAQNSTGELVTSATFNTESRLVKIVFNKGSNVGIGGISVKQLNTDPLIFADNISEIPAIGKTGTSEYSVKNFDDDVTVSEVTGCVTQATASKGVINYTVSPNYTASKAEGTIVLVSASDATVTKTISVSQLKSTLSVSSNEIIIPADATSSSFTITSPEFDWNISADDASNIEFNENGTASNTAVTVNVTSNIESTSELQTIATLTISRAVNDPQAKTVVIKKAEKNDGNEVYYKKVSSISSGKQYIIVGGNSSKALVLSTGTNRKSSADVTITTDGILSNSTVDRYAVTITADTDNQYEITFQIDGTTYYLTYGGSSTNLATPTISDKKWIVRSGTYGTFRFADSSTSTANTKRGLIFRSSTSQFGGYSLANIDGEDYFDIDLYEYQGE